MAYGQDWQQIPLATFQIEQCWIGIGMSQLRRIVPLQYIWRPPLLQHGLMGLIYEQGQFLPLRSLQSQQAPGALEEFYGQVALHPAQLPNAAPLSSKQPVASLPQRWAVIVSSQERDMALAVDGAGMLFPRYRMGEKHKPLPMLLRDWDVQSVLIEAGEIWLLDADSLALSSIAGGS